MSLATWKSEFYPVEAAEVPVEQAIEHSLRKWQGLLAANLSAHGLERKNEYIRDETDCFAVNGDSCALCVHHYASVDARSYRCAKCPLFKLRGEACDSALVSLSPYQAFTGMRGDPLPMINLLQKAKELQDKEESGQNAEEACGSW